MATATAATVPAGGRPYRRARARCGSPRLHRLRFPATAAAAAAAASSSPPAPSSTLPPLPADGGGRLVAELVCAFNELTERMGEDLATSSSSRLLFRALKLALPALRDVDGGGHSRALAVGATLADLQITLFT
ncbi:unnamed protein product [Miscanthus lutarioriparius]|uniref:Uncharacterized protein n=1 Tax=Miscanthus lutarioriparius TaxID=422564 RepID=A0A811SLU1_9POAL|nr:unnamed protein product [Miscanthus lutarioriparius]